MIFLIEYSRPKGHIITFKRFNDSKRSEAENLRLDIELKLSRKKINHEVVLLDARNEAALRRTHRRYFENAAQISKSFSH